MSDIVDELLNSNHGWPSDLAIRAAAEIQRLRQDVIAFCAPWAVEYAKLHELDGLHPQHYDLLKECGARLADFKRAPDPNAKYRPPPKRGA